MHSTEKHINYTFALAVVGLLFFVIGFALGINGLLIPYLQKAFALSSAKSYLVLSATFGTFVLFGYPAGLLIKRIGYKKGMVVAFLFFASGLYLFIPSARYESFPLFILASSVSGIGNTILQAAVNPYVTICGPIQSAARRISVMGILNKLGWAIAPLFLALFLNLSETEVQLSELYIPFYIIVGIFVLLGVFTYLSPLPELKAMGEDEKIGAGSEESDEIIKFVEKKKSVLAFPHLLLGMLLLFLYVGVETITLVTPIDFADTIGLSNPQLYTSYTVIAMIIGYALGIMLIPKVISQHTALKICAATGVVFSISAVIVPPKLAIYFISLMGFSNAMIWGPVWPLAIAYLGKYTKTGASLLVMSIVGGAVLPLIFGWLKDATDNVQQAYWLCVPFYIYTLFYAFRGYKVGVEHLINKTKNQSL